MRASALGVRIRLATPADRGAWTSYVASHPDATGYHDWAWPAVISKSFGHEVASLVAEAADGPESPLVGLLPLVYIQSRLFGLSMTSLPFVNYGGVLADSVEVGRALVEAARVAAVERGCRHVELRHTAQRFADLPCRQHKVAMRLPLGEGLWDRFDRKVRNQVRKARKSGLEAERGGTELLDDFYRVFARNMRDLGTPVYSRRFFDEVLDAFPSSARVTIIRQGRKPVAAGVEYRSRDTIEVPWASSIREYNSLCPNHLLYWTVIGAAVEEGCSVLDFGRSTPGEGTFKFKEQWGAVPVPLTWEYLLLQGDRVPDQSPKNPKFRLAIGVWQRLPLWLANAAGPRIVRGIP